MISLLNDYNNCASLTVAAFAPPHAAEIAEIQLTFPSMDALSDRNRFGLSRVGASDYQRMKASVIIRCPSNPLLQKIQFRQC
ncbi:hypothetical protein [Burkholderia sp. THE68]|uniref:hypothetical protein n=1 Tax=Burkholderia sp. THE68 TaxID=758782 RepID=UPI001389A2AE|nr:hypothetical protein [Burkholderia sp. THE68]